MCEFNSREMGIKGVDRLNVMDRRFFFLVSLSFSLQTIQASANLYAWARRLFTVTEVLQRRFQIERSIDHVLIPVFHVCNLLE